MDVYDARETSRTGHGSLPFLRIARALEYLSEVHGGRR